MCSRDYIDNKIRNAAQLTVKRIKDKTYKTSIYQDNFIDYNDYIEEDTHNFIAFINQLNQ